MGCAILQMMKNLKLPNKNNPNTKYDPKAIELKWQSKWQESGIYQPDLETANSSASSKSSNDGSPQGKPFYNLMMFPYPSAEGLHVGSFFTYGGIDAYGRFKKLQGYNVFEPMGLDGFGIHSENYAIKVGRTPQEHAKISEKNFYRQLHELGNMFDWSRKLETYDPDYYKWTQWLFVVLFKAGLAYKAMAKVNFCPSCKTVLADEQVIDGKCERCGTIVEKRDLAQWFFRITEYAERLLGNLETLDWSDKVKNAQKNWIGKSEGAKIEFRIKDTEQIIDAFTTRPDTLYGVTFLVLAPEHPIIASVLSGELKIANGKVDEVKKYVKRASEKSDAERTEEKEKTGVFTGFYTINPVNGEEIPVWVADYVLMGYGTGAIMAVPAHDSRDFEFAKKYNLPIKQVISEEGRQQEIEEAYSGSGMLINSGNWNGLEMPQEMDRVLLDLEKKHIGTRMATYHLRDWLISRQRYWAAPIPLIYCEACARKDKSWFDTDEGKKQQTILPPHQSVVGWYPEEKLPVVLPEVKDFKPLGTGKAPLASYPEFYETTCPGCGGPAIRETDVCDTFLDSSWYFLRYLATDLLTLPFPMKDSKAKTFSGATEKDSARAEKRTNWLPVTSYIGGAEHSVLHLLYARFVTMVLHDLGYVPFEEPFTKFRHNGLIIKDGAKMSKSRGNVINPDDYIKKYGADTLRVYLAFVGPFSDGGDFRDTGVEGTYRFLKRVWTLIADAQIVGKEMDNAAKHIMHKTIKGITEDMEELRFNTAIAKLMTWYNALRERGEITQIEAETFIQMLAPFAPHMTEELWQRLGHTDSIHTSSWPVYDEKYLAEDMLTVVVQVNGKMRGSFEIPSAESKDQKPIEDKAKKLEKVAKQLAGKTVKKVIYVPGKIINFVLN